MGRWAVGIGLGLVVGGILHWIQRRQDRPLSAAWLRHQDRSSDGSGVDQVAICWPIQKITNEAGQFNTQRLRKRA